MLPGVQIEEAMDNPHSIINNPLTMDSNNTWNNI